MEKCWKGYEKKGMKTMFGKRYPNCVKKEDVQVDEKVNLKDKSSQYARSTKEVDTAMTDHVNRTKGRHYGKDGKVTEVGRYRRPSKKEARKELVDLYKKEETQLEDSRLTSSNDMQSKMYADKNKSGKKMSDDEIKKEKGGKEFLARLKAAKEKMKKEETELEKLQRAIKTGMMNGAKLTPEQIQGLKAGLTQGGNKVDEGIMDTLKDIGKKVINKTKEIYNKPIMKPNITKDQHLQKIKNSGGDPSHWANSYKPEGEMIEGSSYGITRGSGKPSGPMAAFAKKEKEKKKGKLKTYEEFQKECWKTHKQVGYKKKGGKMVPNCVPKNEEVEIIDEKKSPAWQRKAGKNPSGGLNKKGVASYRAANPGSKLKTAVTTKPSKLKKGSKAANRRKSFCARMTGMKKRLTSAKTARDPDSRINKALRKWNC